MVETRRIELLTPCLQGRCSPSWATPPFACLFVTLLCCSSSPLVDVPLTYVSVRFVIAPRTVAKILRTITRYFAVIRYYTSAPLVSVSLYTLRSVTSLRLVWQQNHVICFSFCRLRCCFLLTFGGHTFKYVSARFVIAPRTVAKLLRNTILSSHFSVFPQN